MYNESHEIPCKCSTYRKVTELPRTKIYEYDTGQLLGEFVIDEKKLENASFKEAMKAAFKAYRFYNP